MLEIGEERSEKDAMSRYISDTDFFFDVIIRHVNLSRYIWTHCLEIADSIMDAFDYSSDRACYNEALELLVKDGYLKVNGPCLAMSCKGIRYLAGGTEPSDMQKCE